MSEIGKGQHFGESPRLRIGGNKDIQKFRIITPHGVETYTVANALRDSRRVGIREIDGDYVFSKPNYPVIVQAISREGLFFDILTQSDNAVSIHKHVSVGNYSGTIDLLESLPKDSNVEINDYYTIIGTDKKQLITSNSLRRDSDYDLVLAPSGKLTVTYHGAKGGQGLVVYAKMSKFEVLFYIDFEEAGVQRAEVKYDAGFTHMKTGAEVKSILDTHDDEPQHSSVDISPDGTIVLGVGEYGNPQLSHTKIAVLQNGAVHMHELETKTISHPQISVEVTIPSQKSIDMKKAFGISPSAKVVEVKCAESNELVTVNHHGILNIDTDAPPVNMGDSEKSGIRLDGKNVQVLMQIKGSDPNFPEETKEFECILHFTSLCEVPAVDLFYGVMDKDLVIPTEVIFPKTWKNYEYLPIEYEATSDELEYEVNTDRIVVNTNVTEAKTYSVPLRFRVKGEEIDKFVKLTVVVPKSVKVHEKTALLPLYNGTNSFELEEKGIVGFYIADNDREQYPVEAIIRDERDMIEVSVDQITSSLYVRLDQVNVAPVPRIHVLYKEIGDSDIQEAVYSFKIFGLTFNAKFLVPQSTSLYARLNDGAYLHSKHTYSYRLTNSSGNVESDQYELSLTAPCGFLECKENGMIHFKPSDGFKTGEVTRELGYTIHFIDNKTLAIEQLTITYEDTPHHVPIAMYISLDHAGKTFGDVFYNEFSTDTAVPVKFDGVEKHVSVFGGSKSAEVNRVLGYRIGQNYYNVGEIAYFRGGAFKANEKGSFVVSVEFLEKRKEKYLPDVELICSENRRLHVSFQYVDKTITQGPFFAPILASDVTYTRLPLTPDTEVDGIRWVGGASHRAESFDASFISDRKTIGNMKIGEVTYETSGNIKVKAPSGAQMRTVEVLLKNNQETKRTTKVHLEVTDSDGFVSKYAQIVTPWVLPTGKRISSYRFLIGPKFDHQPILRVPDDEVLSAGDFVEPGKITQLAKGTRFTVAFARVSAEGMIECWVNPIWSAVVGLEILLEGDSEPHVFECNIFTRRDSNTKEEVKMGLYRRIRAMINNRRSTHRGIKIGLLPLGAHVKIAKTVKFNGNSDNEEEVVHKEDDGSAEESGKVIEIMEAGSYIDKVARDALMAKKVATCHEQFGEKFVVLNVDEVNFKDFRVVRICQEYRSVGCWITSPGVITNIAIPDVWASCASTDDKFFDVKADFDLYSGVSLKLDKKAGVMKVPDIHKLVATNDIAIKQHKFSTKIDVHVRDLYPKQFFVQPGTEAKEGKYPGVFFPHKLTKIMSMSWMAHIRGQEVKSDATFDKVDGKISQVGGDQYVVFEQEGIYKIVGETHTEDDLSRVPFTIEVNVCGGNSVGARFGLHYAQLFAYDKTICDMPRNSDAPDIGYSRPDVRPVLHTNHAIHHVPVPTSVETVEERTARVEAEGEHGEKLPVRDSSNMKSKLEQFEDDVIRASTVTKDLAKISALKDVFSRIQSLKNDVDAGVEVGEELLALRRKVEEIMSVYHNVTKPTMAVGAYAKSLTRVQDIRITVPVAGNTLASLGTPLKAKPIKSYDVKTGVPVPISSFTRHHGDITVAGHTSVHYNSDAPSYVTFEQPGIYHVSQKCGGKPTHFYQFNLTTDGAPVSKFEYRQTRTPLFKLESAQKAGATPSSFDSVVKYYKGTTLVTEKHQESVLHLPVDKKDHIIPCAIFASNMSDLSTTNLVVYSA